MLNFVNFIPTCVKVYMMQLYFIMFVRYMRQFVGVPLVTSVFSTNKTDPHNITEIELKVMLNTNKFDPHNHTYNHTLIACIEFLAYT